MTKPTDDTPHPNSPADLKAPPPVAVAETTPPRKWSDAEWEALNRDLDEIQITCRSNKADEAYAMITVCIQRGADTARHIITALKPYGYSQGQVGSMLTKGKRPWWRKNSEGRYTLTAHHPLMEEAAEEAATS